MTSPDEITGALRLLVALADDLPDGMGDEARDLMRDWRARPRQDPAGVAESIRELCAEFGYPNPLGDSDMPVTTILDPDEQNLLVFFRRLRSDQQAALLVLLRLILDRRDPKPETDGGLMLTFD